MKKYDGNLFGDPKSFARNHAGLEAFWRCTLSEIGHIPYDEPDKDILLFLDDWLTKQQKHVLFLASKRILPCTWLLTRWAQSIVKRRRAYTMLISVSHIFGMAIERDFLQVLYGMFPFHTELYVGPQMPRTIYELRKNVQQSMNYGFDPDEILEPDEPENICTIQIIDGIDRGADWSPDIGKPIIGKNSGGYDNYIVVSLCADDPLRAAKQWQNRLCRTELDSIVFEVPPDLYRDYEDTKIHYAIVKAKNESTGLIENTLDALSVTLAPITADDLNQVFGLDQDHSSISGILSSVAGELIIHEANGTFHFANESLRLDWVSKIDSARFEELENIVVERGLHLLSCLKKGENIKFPIYLVEYLGAHMTRCAASRQDLMQLVSPHWLNLWMNNPNSLVGFLTDERRARKAAEKELYHLCNPEQRISVLRDLVYCGVVECSLLSKHGGDFVQEDYEDDKRPYKAPQVDLTVPTGIEKWRRFDANEKAGSDRERLELLLTFADILDEPERAEVLELAHAAKKEYLEQGGNESELTIHHVPGVHDPVDGNPSWYIDYINKHGELDHRETMNCLDSSPKFYVDRFGYEKAISEVRKSKDEDDVIRSWTAASLTPHIPLEMRKDFVAELMQSYWVEDGRIMVWEIIGCSPWMSDVDATKLFCKKFGNKWDEDFKGFLRGITLYGGLLLRLGGPRALVEVTHVVADVGKWIP